MNTDCRATALQLLSAIGLALTSVGCSADGAATGDPKASASTRATSSAASAAPSASQTAAAAPTITAEPSASAAPSASAVASSSAAPSASAVASAPPKPQVPVGLPKPRTVEGRPFIVDGEARLAPCVAASTWSGRPPSLAGSPAERADARSRIERIDATTRDALIEHFTAWTLAEHASVASFARFTMQLLAVGAPASLVAASVRAGADEIRHAQIGFRFLARLHHDAAPGRLTVTNALSEGVSLETVFRLVVRESILGETVAAVEAAHVVHAIECPSFRAETQALAEDEARHAELGFLFAAWAIERDPSLRGALSEELAAFTLPELRPAAGIEAWGVLSSDERRRIHVSAHELLIRPLCERLLGPSRPQHGENARGDATVEALRC